MWQVIGMDRYFWFCYQTGKQPPRNVELFCWFSHDCTLKMLAHNIRGESFLSPQSYIGKYLYSFDSRCFFGLLVNSSLNTKIRECYSNMVHNIGIYSLCITVVTEQNKIKHLKKVFSPIVCVVLRIQQPISNPQLFNHRCITFGLIWSRMPTY